MVRAYISRPVDSSLFVGIRRNHAQLRPYTTNVSTNSFSDSADELRTGASYDPEPTHLRWMPNRGGFNRFSEHVT